jgi:hypothetical protein
MTLPRGQSGPVKGPERGFGEDLIGCVFHDSNYSVPGQAFLSRRRFFIHTYLYIGTDMEFRVSLHAGHPYSFHHLW